MSGRAFGAQRTRARHVTKLVLCTQTMTVKRMIDPVLDAAASAASTAAASAASDITRFELGQLMLWNIMMHGTRKRLVVCFL